MDRQARVDLILDHYQNPRHAGRLEPADVVLQGGNPGCGDEITIYMRVGQADEVAVLSYEGHGCTISQAAASMVMELMNGQTVEQIETASVEPVLEKLGHDIAGARLKCATLAFNTVQEAARAYQRQRLKDR